MGARWIVGFRDEIPGYPTLSKLNGQYYEDMWFEKEEILNLKNECLKLTATTKNQIALSGLKKLLNACEIAEKNKLAIYFVAN